MQKIQLKDGTQFDIRDGSTENNYQAVIADMTAFSILYTKLTDINLSKFKILNIDTNEVLGAFTDKSLSKIYPQTIDNLLVAVIELKPADTISKNIKDLQMSQEYQTKAIFELSKRIGGN